MTGSSFTVGFEILDDRPSAKDRMKFTVQVSDRMDNTDTSVK